MFGSERSIRVALFAATPELRRIKVAFPERTLERFDALAIQEAHGGLQAVKMFMQRVLRTFVCYENVDLFAPNAVGGAGIFVRKDLIPGLQCQDGLFCQDSVMPNVDNQQTVPGRVQRLSIVALGLISLFITFTMTT